MSKRGESKSLSADVYSRIREEIYNGTLAPGSRLQPSVLGERYNASTTVIREALALLAGERLVQSRTGQGFFIPMINKDELVDLTTVLCHVEGLALRMSMERGGLEWESSLIAAHHRLARTPRRTEKNPDRYSQDWSNAHKEFHATLLGACDVPLLLDMCQQLMLATELYRVWVSPLVTHNNRDYAGEHAALLEAVLAGDADTAVSLLNEHARTTANMIIENWPEDTEAMIADGIAKYGVE